MVLGFLVVIGSTSLTNQLYMLSGVLVPPTIINEIVLVTHFACDNSRTVEFDPIDFYEEHIL